jgi:hypothetical protein
VGTIQDATAPAVARPVVAVAMPKPIATPTAGHASFSAYPKATNPIATAKPPAKRVVGLGQLSVESFMIYFFL